MKNKIKVSFTIKDNTYNGIKETYYMVAEKLRSLSTGKRYTLTIKEAENMDVEKIRGWYFAQIVPTYLRLVFKRKVDCVNYSKKEIELGHRSLCNMFNRYAILLVNGKIAYTGGSMSNRDTKRWSEYVSLCLQHLKENYDIHLYPQDKDTRESYDQLIEPNL